ncbi:HNH/ENDO VII family nuclease [Mediterraneibacter glycyrrhizinilyticus]|uniref:HNH/ENDO VII family nuclease n=1 Tax=Mediterraneibacter glycyrrhizinilyticus TaxID=342942 RepID=UPI003A7F37DF
MFCFCRYMRSNEIIIDGYELHHIRQKGNSTLKILTRAEHRQGDNHKIWHYVNNVTENLSSQAGWSTTKEEFWINIVELLGK